MSSRRFDLTLRLTAHEARVLDDALLKYTMWGAGDLDNTRDDERDIARAQRVLDQVRRHPET